MTLDSSASSDRPHKEVDKLIEWCRSQVPTLAVEARAKAGSGSCTGDWRKVEAATAAWVGAAFGAARGKLGSDAAAKNTVLAVIAEVFKAMAAGSVIKKEREYLNAALHRKIRGPRQPRERTVPLGVQHGPIGSTNPGWQMELEEAPQRTSSGSPAGPDSLWH